MICNCAKCLTNKWLSNQLQISATRAKDLIELARLSDLKCKAVK